MLGGLGGTLGIRQGPAFPCCHLRLYAVLGGADNLCGSRSGELGYHRPDGFWSNLRLRMFSELSQVLS